MAEEVRIVARFDDSDIQNGVRRSEEAAREMKRVWEASTWVGPAIPYDMERRTQEQLDAMKDWPAFERSGAGAGDSFMKGFLGRLLLRDAIYGLISGIMSAVNTAMDDLNKAVGDKSPHEGFWKNVGHTMSFATRMIFPSINQSDVAQTQAEIARENSLRQMDEIVTHAREDPSQLKDTSFYQGQLDAVLEQRKKNQEDYNRERMILAESGSDNPAALAGARANFEPDERYFAQMEAHLRELVSMGKSRDNKLNEEAKVASEKDFRDRNKAIDDADHMRAVQREADIKEAAKAKAAEKLAERVRKNHREHEIAGILTGDEAKETSGSKDLRFTEEEIKKHKATSVVMINGGIFGRSDSVGALVSHAQQTVSELRAIKAEITALRKERGDLTLL
jgi:hypothetical protein